MHLFMQFNPKCAQKDGDIHIQRKMEAERGTISAQRYSQIRLYQENQYQVLIAEFVAGHHKYFK